MKKDDFLAVRIVSALNDSHLFTSKKKISVMAVEQELSNLAHYILDYGVNDKLTILAKYNEFNKHSIVCSIALDHCIGYFHSTQ